jgi:flagellar operon protein
MNINQNRPVTSIHQFVQAPVKKSDQVQGDGAFATLLEQKIQETGAVKFSRHAEQRLKDRNIQLDDRQLERLTEAVDKASSKGVRDTLVMMDDVAMVVNVKNRTVITAVTKDELRENVFTNIDGAVFT